MPNERQETGETMTCKEYYDQIKERFDKEIVEHEMTIHQDRGLYRHIVFAVPGTNIYHFNLTTFPNYLIISGDMGTYAFSRVEDMFRFFRNERICINPSYWGEKLKSISTNGGYEKFNVDEFKQGVEESFEAYREYLDDKELADKIWADIKMTVIDPANDDGAGWVAMQSAIEYRYEDILADINIGNIFQDFWEHSCNRFDYNYIWCLWAIVHGIKMYDEFKKN